MEDYNLNEWFEKCGILKSADTTLDYKTEIIEGMNSYELLNDKEASK